MEKKFRDCVRALLDILALSQKYAIINHADTTGIARLYWHDNNRYIAHIRNVHMSYEHRFSVDEVESAALNDIGLVTITLKGTE